MAIHVQMFSQTIINRLTDQAYRTLLTWIRSLSIIFKNWHNWAIKKRRYGRLPPVKNTVANPPQVTRSDKLRCNSDELFQQKLDLASLRTLVITRIAKQFRIFRSRIQMVLMEIMFVACNGSDTTCERW